MTKPGTQRLFTHLICSIILLSGVTCFANLQPEITRIRFENPPSKRICVDIENLTTGYTNVVEYSRRPNALIWDQVYAFEATGPSTNVCFESPGDLGKAHFRMRTLTPPHAIEMLSDEIATMPYHPVFDQTAGSMTLEILIQPESTLNSNSTSSTFARLGDNAGEDAWSLGYNAGSLLFSAYDESGANTAISAPIDFAASNCYQLAVAVRPGTVELIVDGMLVGQGAFAGPVRHDSYDLVIGGGFTGGADEIRLWDT